jgi:hypothetical protein
MGARQDEVAGHVQDLACLNEASVARVNKCTDELDALQQEHAAAAKASVEATTASNAKVMCVCVCACLPATP